MNTELFKDLLGVACIFLFLAAFPSFVVSANGCFFDTGVSNKGVSENGVSEKGVYFPLTYLLAPRFLHGILINANHVSAQSYTQSRTHNHIYPTMYIPNAATFPVWPGRFRTTQVLPTSQPSPSSK